MKRRSFIKSLAACSVSAAAFSAGIAGSALRAAARAGDVLAKAAGKLYPGPEKKIDMKDIEKTGPWLG